MNTPSQVLAAIILQQLVGEHLLVPDALGKLHARLAEGKLRPEDWRLAIELGDSEVTEHGPGTSQETHD